MGGHGAVADAHLGDARERGLQRGQKLALELGVDEVAGVDGIDVAAHVLVEHQGVDELVGVLAVAADGDVDVEADLVVDHAERHGARGAVLVADDLLGVEVVDPLVLAGVPAEGEAASDLLERLLYHVAEVAREDGGLGAGVVDELAGLCADLDDLAVFHDHHALAVGDGHDGAVGDDVVLALGVGAAAAGALLALGDQGVCVERLAIEVFAPLIGQNAASCPYACLKKSHDRPLSSVVLVR